MSHYGISVVNVKKTKMCLEQVVVCLSLVALSACALLLLFDLMVVVREVTLPELTNVVLNELILKI